MRIIEVDTTVSNQVVNALRGFEAVKMYFGSGDQSGLTGGKTMNFTNGAELLEYCEKERKRSPRRCLSGRRPSWSRIRKDEGKDEKGMVDHAGVGEKAVEGEHRQHGRHDRRESRKLHTTPGERKEYLRDVVSKAIAYAVGF